MTGAPPPERGPLDQALKLFGDVRTGEGATVLLMSLNVFVGTHQISGGVAGFARVNIVIVSAALVVAVLLLREYRRLTAPQEGAAAAA